MSKENIKKFYEALKADKALAEELQNAVKAANAETPEQAKAVVLQFAAKKNFAFTAEEAVEFENEARELSEDELDQVNAAGVCLVSGSDVGRCAPIGRDDKDKVKCFVVGFFK